jgi:hypothetical protein
MIEKGGRGKMVTTVKPIRPTEVQFDSQKDMDNFIHNEVLKKKLPSKKMNDLMKKHIQQRKK